MNAILTVGSVVARPLRLRSVLATWTRRMQSRGRLAELDDRLLADIGLTRDDVRKETRKPFWVA